MNMDELKKLHNGSDIRGVAMEGVKDEKVNLTPEICCSIAASFLLFIQDQTGKKPQDITIGVGHDSRLTAETLKGGIIRGLSAYGCKIYDCGLASTPSMFMGTQFPETNFDGSIMITASHLPFNRNGMKFFQKSGGLEKNDIGKILATAAELQVEAPAQGAAVNIDLIDIYARFLRENIIKEINDPMPLKGIKIVLDAGNGAGGFFEEKVLKALGADTAGSIYLEPDGNFPNHIPNPENAKAIAAIQKATLDSKADLGLIFDTDVDRAAVVLSDGQTVNRNAIIAIMGAIIAKKYPGTTVVTDSVTSNQLTDFLENKLHLKHHRFKRGYKNVINEAIRLNEAGEETHLAIETSGHCALKENYFLDDGAYLCVKIVAELALCKKNQASLSTLLEGFEEPAESKEFRLKINLDDFAPYGKEVLDQFIGFVEKENSFSLAPNSYEGVRVSTQSPAGVIVLRQSLHDPQVVLNIESDKAGGINEIIARILPFFKTFSQLDLSCF